MTILYLANLRMPTEKAHGIQIMKTCDALAGAGHAVTLVIPSFNRSSEAQIFDAYAMRRTFSIETVPCPSLLAWGAIGFLVRAVIYARAASKLLRQKAARGVIHDVIYTRDEAIIPFLSSSRAPVFYEMHDVRSGKLQRLALRSVRGVVTISNALADRCRTLGIAPNKISVAPDAVDVGRFAVPESAEACRRRLGLPLDQKIALYTGHLYEWKGADTLARAAALLPPGTLTVFVGGTERDRQAFRERHAHDERIRIEGHKPHDLIPYYLKAADVAVIPNSGKTEISRLYTSPMKLFEYMASGTPIVASDLPSIREVIDESSAFFARPDDPADLARAIKAALEDVSGAHERAVHASRIAAGSTWGHRAEKISAFIAAARNARKDSSFYDEASASYSESRYPRVSADYNHFFFKRRLEIAREMIERWMRTDPERPAPELLEIGCADGIVLRALHDRFGSRIARYAGIDLSAGMVDAARAKSSGKPFSFSVRDAGACYEGNPDLVLEIGVLNYADFAREMSCVATRLPSEGRYICSIAGKGSLWDRFVRVEKGFANFMTYQEYERIIEAKFCIIEQRGVGLRIPLIWRAPVLARPIQYLTDALLGRVAPGLFHEKVYVLALKAGATTRG